MDDTKVSSFTPLRRLQEMPRRFALGFALLCSLVGCRGEDQSPTVRDALSYLKQDDMRAVAKETRGATCSSAFVLIMIGFKARGVGCYRHVGDTLFYAYRTDSGENLLRAKRIPVPAERLSRLADSLQRAISASFGQAVDCETHFERLSSTRFSFWRRKGRTLFLRSMMISGPKMSTITLESALGDRTCEMYVGGPPTYY